MNYYCEEELLILIHGMSDHTVDNCQKMSHVRKDHSEPKQNYQM